MPKSLTKYNNEIKSLYSLRHTPLLRMIAACSSIKSKKYLNNYMWKRLLYVKKTTVKALGSSLRFNTSWNLKCNLVKLVNIWDQLRSISQTPAINSFITLSRILASIRMGLLQNGFTTHILWTDRMFIALIFYFIFRLYGRFAVV